MTILRISDIIECRHITSIIACLYMRGPMNRTALYHSVSTNPRMGQKIDFLVDEGVVTCRQEGRLTNVSLTEKGMRLAESLCDMENAMYGSVGNQDRIAQENLYLDGRSPSCAEWYNLPARTPRKECRQEQ